jgi:hypothetical protein
MPFYRQPVRIGSIAPGPARRSPTTLHRRFFRPFFGKIMNFLQNDKKGLILSEKNRNI